MAETKEISPEERATAQQKWLEEYPWLPERKAEHQKAFLHYVQHMRGPARNCAGPSTDLLCLAAFMFGKDLESVDWWRELLTAVESDLRRQLGELQAVITVQAARITSLESQIRNPIPTRKTGKSKR
jgi:hypothetical protein